VHNRTIVIREVVCLNIGVVTFIKLGEISCEHIVEIYSYVAVSVWSTLLVKQADRVAYLMYWNAPLQYIR
jgi:hypothetical protein